jgi:hypothetical protein
MSGLAIKGDCRKTWAQFKLDFATAYREFRLTNQTSQQSGFHSANMVIEQGREEAMQGTVDAIAQLTAATASDRGTVATLTVTNAKLASQLEAVQAYIKTFKDEILELKANIKHKEYTNHKHALNGQRSNIP